MQAPFECVNCGRIYAADKLSKCPVCAASGPMIAGKINLDESASLSTANHSRDEKTPFWVHLARILILAIVLMLIVAFVHDLITGQLPGGGGGYEDSEYPGFERR
jgi:hypothetical protein